MRRLLCPLFVLIVSTTYGQSKSLIKDFCTCTPLTYSNTQDSHQLYFIEKVEDGQEDTPFALHLRKIEKRSHSWQLLSDEILDLSTITLSEEDLQNNYENYFDYVFPAKERQMEFINLAQKDYLYTVLRLGKSGTAYNGLHEYLFVFQDRLADDPPLLYYYERSEYENGFTLRSSDRTSNPKDPFYTFIVNFVQDHLRPKEPSYYIDETEIFQWRDWNPRLFSNLQQSKSSSIQFVTHDSITFYKEHKRHFGNPEVQNEHYQAHSGFRSPVFVYDKKKDQSLLVFIPNGWPNGGAWGTRSYNVTQLKGNKLYLESENDLLIIDLAVQSIERRDAEP